MRTLQTIFHLTDLAESSDFAFQLSWSLARDRGARLVLLQLIPSPVVFAHEIPAGSIADGATAEEAWQELSNRSETRFPGETGFLSRRHPLIVPQGDVGRAIREFADQLNCSLIVVSQGQTGFDRLFLRSVTDQLAGRFPVVSLTTSKQPPPINQVSQQLACVS